MTAVTVHGLPFTAAGFDHDAHARHVAAGYCPVVQSTKAWCILRAGHHVRGNDLWLDHASALITPGTRRPGVKSWGYA